MNVVAQIGFLGAKLGALRNKKLKLWVEGRKKLSEKIKTKIDSDAKVMWFHAASYGEFEEGRPLIEKIKEEYPHYKIVITFFSPSGYEAHQNYPLADGVFYLPIDTTRQVNAFLDALHPEIAVFIKYEFWPNLLAVLQKRKIRTFVISARFIPKSRFFKWYGSIFRKGLRTFEKIFVQDENSIKLLHSIGIKNGVLAGDPRFDRVKTIAQTEWEDKIIERFKGNDFLFIAGSTVGKPDEELIQQLINKHPDVKFLVVPHEMDVAPMEQMISETNRKSILYSHCSEQTDVSDFQLLILDKIGMLAKVYRYGTFAFIGGGFDLGIHSVIEATIYGLPAAFGPNFEKNRPGIDMIKLGACQYVKNFQELDAWFTTLKTNPETLNKTSKIAYDYTNQNTGATDLMLQNIFGKHP